MQTKYHCATTSAVIEASRGRVWAKVGFYEHVDRVPGLYLKLSLPVPREVRGSHAAVGDICRCLYSDGGYLTKRITAIEPGARIEFEITEQSIRHRHRVRLRGGYIEVAPVGATTSLVQMGTYYENRIRPRALSRPLVESVIKAMHRFVMQDMREQLTSASGTGALREVEHHG